ncbi:hypothetical protein HH310_02465 [Actinoplanes sp. TBRC 11911]|uniref:hypothetical protein n=1 Tax=Actinoplanes sp. TBRC 11911 TaxID=2729386 RepID=UPI00145EE607|nr:hypothetical protein [Actinoplanes sp. TBRC 11911]NMO50060.1 hypothetical protein [Actinoplanes sp. TBRC 11911]
MNASITLSALLADGVESMVAAPLSDLLAELAELGREAAILDGQFRAAAAASSEASARDSSEQVRVVLTAAGRIETVEVLPGWRAHLTAQELADAVLFAFREAGNRRMETWAAAVGTDAGTRLSAPPSTAADGGTVRDLWYLLQDATDRLDDLAREASARSRAITTGRDAHDQVTATLTGGELTGLRVGERAGRDVGAAITAAIRDGYAAADEASSITGRWPFPELERFTSDPATLLSTLGLAAPPTDPQR